MSVPVNYQFAQGCVTFFDTIGRRRSRKDPWTFTRNCEDIQCDLQEVRQRVLEAIPTPLPAEAHTILIGPLEAAVLYALGCLRRRHFEPCHKVEEGPEYISVPNVYLPDSAQALTVVIRRDARQVALLDEYGSPV